MHNHLFLDSIFHSVIEGISFGIKDGYEAVHAVSQKSKKIYLVGGGSKSEFWADFMSSTLNDEIIVSEDSELGPALGVARLAMLATKEYKNSDIIKNMASIRNCSPSKNISDLLSERYQKWTSIINAIKPISKKITE